MNPKLQKCRRLSTNYYTPVLFLDVNYHSPGLFLNTNCHTPHSPQFFNPAAVPQRKPNQAQGQGGQVPTEQMGAMSMRTAPAQVNLSTRIESICSCP